MAVSHAEPGAFIEVRPLGANLGNNRTTTVIKTPYLELIRLMLPTGKQIPPHRVPGVITIHCLEGQAAVIALGRTQELGAGQMLYLPKGVEHSLLGVDDASVLVTLQLPAKEATVGSGASKTS